MHLSKTAPLSVISPGSGSDCSAISSAGPDAKAVTPPVPPGVPGFVPQPPQAVAPTKSGENT